MTGAPTDPQSCCHPSSPRSSSRMVWSPSNRGPGFAAHGPEAIGKSIDTPQPSLASCPPPPPSLWPNEDEAVVVLHTLAVRGDPVPGSETPALVRGLAPPPSLMYLSCQPASVSPNIWTERRRDGD